MRTRILQLWQGTAKTAVFCSFISSLLSPACLASGPPPNIVVQPLDQTVLKHASVTFTVVATSTTALSYQWNFKSSGNTPILGATNSTFTIYDVSSLDAGKYSVTVINAGGSKISKDALLTIINTPPIANNDAFTTAQNVPITNGVAPASTSMSANLLGINGGGNGNTSANSLLSISATVSNPAGVLDNDTDIDGDILTATLVSPTSNGTLIFYSNGTFDYTPNLDFVGIDSFTYVANDGTDNSAIATANITVTAVSSNATPPNAVTLDATEVLSVSATLNGTINPQGNVVSYYFQYGTTTNYGLATSPVNVGADTNSINVAAAVSGLVRGTNYHFSVVATGPGGMSVGDDFMFATPLVDTTPLAVSVTGPGVVTPAINGQSLIIGQSYTLSASPSNGCTFVNWQDANGSIVTNSSALTFVMASNLSFTANFVDNTRPAISFSGIPASYTVSNQLVTINGTATDNISVAGVLFNLNNVGWAAAATSNNWSNWSTMLALNAGTNLLAVTALDASGNYSTTNMVSIFYVPVAVLTVRANGQGTISPALNGATVRLGSTITLTATATNSNVFTNWTYGTGAIVTNKAALTFVMTSNLSFVANFVDVAKPTVTITSPTNLISVTKEFIVATGKATDNVGVARVLYQLNGGSWYPASLTNATAWSVMLDLTPGTNTFAVYSQDAAGNSSTTNTIRFPYTTLLSSLVGQRALVTLDTGSSFEMAFSTNTFSQLADNTNAFTSVGNYSYTKLSPSRANIALTYVAPPQSTNVAAQTLVLNFTAPGIATFSNAALATTGTIVFQTVTNKVPATLAKLSLFLVSATGGASSNSVMTNGTIVSTDLRTRLTTKWTNYTYTAYSPLAALLKERGTNAASYIVVNFLSTNSAITYTESYDGTGAFTAKDFGTFIIASQRTGGNAPTNIVNSTLAVFSMGSNFKIATASNTFAQYSSTPANDTGVGNYTYSRVTNNQGLILMTFSAPQYLSDATDSASFNFVAPNLAVFTNSDGTFGSAIVGKSASLAPNSLAGTTITLTNGVTTNVSLFTFDGAGNFTVSGDLNGSGTANYGVFSPETGQVQLNFMTGAFAGDLGYIQLEYASQFTGKYFISVFDSTNNLVGQGYGSFGP